MITHPANNNPTDRKIKVENSFKKNPEKVGVNSPAMFSFDDFLESFNAFASMTTMVVSTDHDIAPFSKCVFYYNIVRKMIKCQG